MKYLAFTLIFVITMTAYTIIGESLFTDAQYYAVSDELFETYKVVRHEGPNPNNHEALRQLVIANYASLPESEFRKALPDATELVIASSLDAPPQQVNSWHLRRLPKSSQPNDVFEVVQRISPVHRWFPFH
jgi:hypothetical protein